MANKWVVKVMSEQRVSDRMIVMKVLLIIMNINDCYDWRNYYFSDLSLCPTMWFR